MINLLALIGRDTPLKRTCATQGGEYSGPCPLCRRGTDRFKVWPRRERWACLGPQAGRAGCDRGGDAAQYLRERDGLTYREACAQLHIDLNAKAQRDRRSPSKDAKRQRDRRTPGKEAKEGEFFAPLRRCVESSPPNATWQAHARGWAAACAAHLWRPEGAPALAYLHSRGLSDEILRASHVGYNPRDCHEEHSQWGLTRGAPECGSRQHIWIPQGITLPWFSGGALWRFNVRRLLTPAQLAAGEARYIGPAGFANALYNASALSNLPVILVEGELDALTIVQAYSGNRAGQVAAVATGSTAGARREPWITRLAAAPLVLLAFDNDQSNGAGDKAAAWWCSVLPNARRWRPLLHDINIRPSPADVRAWLAPALEGPNNV